MATPYNPFSPPPTAGPLPIIERANLNTPYSGGGGGNPSTIGPNPSFSTITIASQSVGDPQNLRLSVDTFNNVIFGGGVYGVIMPPLNASTITTDTISVSSISVSSINGAVPGGSVPADLTLSTLIVAGSAAVSTLRSLNNGNPLLIDGYGQSVVVSGNLFSVPTAPVSISTATISSINGLVPGAVPNPLYVSSIFVSSINGLVPGAVPDPLSLSSLNVSSLNGGAPAAYAFKSFTSYTDQGISCTLGPSYYSLVNNVGQLVLTFPETPGASWSGGTKYIKFGPAFTSGGMPQQWNFDNVSITCNDGVGAYRLDNWVSLSGGNQLSFNVALGGGPSSFAITAQVRTA